MEGTYWHPGTAGVNRQLGVCTQHPISAQAMLSEPYSDGAPVAINGPTLIIWSRRGCSACMANEGLFRRLRTYSAGYHVFQVEATPDMVRRYPHVKVLPTYDVVRPLAGSQSPYGDGFEVHSIPNNARGELARLFPQALKPEDVMPARGTEPYRPG
jgi:hypothetical protein